jgi:hypothetical protein
MRIRTPCSSFGRWSLVLCGSNLAAGDYRVLTTGLPRRGGSSWPRCQLLP